MKEKSMSLRVLIYEHYDTGLFGNHKYISFLLKSFSDPQGGLDLKLVVPTRRKMFDLMQRFTKVSCLDGLSGWKRTFAMISYVRRVRPQVIQCHNEKSLVTMLPAALSCRVPLVWYIKNSKHRFLSDLVCFVFARRILCNAPPNLLIPNRWLRRLFRKKIYLELNAVPLCEFESIPLPHSTRDDALKILLAGSITPRKGIDTAIDAMRALQRAGEEAILRIAGTPPPGWEAYAAGLQQSSKNLKQGSIEWLGYAENLAAHLQRSDVAILPAKAEGIPQFLRQAMAAGRPVVTTNVGGNPYLVEDGKTGFLIPIGDARALAERLQLFSRSRKTLREMGEKARKRVFRLYDVDKHLRSLEEHLHAVARKGNRR